MQIGTFEFRPELLIVRYEVAVAKLDFLSTVQIKICSCMHCSIILESAIDETEQALA